MEAPRRSPERTHITNFMKANSPEQPRRLSPVARRSPLAAAPLPPVSKVPVHPPSPTDRPHSEPPKRKAYARDEVSINNNKLYCDIWKRLLSICLDFFCTNIYHIY